MPSSSPEGGATPEFPVRSLAEVARLCASPWGLEEYGPLDESPCLLIGTNNGETVPGDPARIAARLRELPCPVLALGPGVPPPLQRGVDVVVESRVAARPLLGHIKRHPVAAMTLVQLLRHNEDVEPAQGLLVESLAYATLQGGPEFAAVHARGLNPAPAVEEKGPPVLVSRRGAELCIRFNRPGARNAYNAAMRDALYEALQLLHADDDLALAVVTGEGACFSVGGDLAEFGGVAHAGTAHAIRSARNVASLLLALAPRLEFHLHSACIAPASNCPPSAAASSDGRTRSCNCPSSGTDCFPARAARSVSRAASGASARPGWRCPGAGSTRQPRCNGDCWTRWCKQWSIRES